MFLKSVIKFIIVIGCTILPLTAFQGTLRAEPNNSMNTSFVYDTGKELTAVCTSANSKIIAVGSSDKYLYLFQEDGQLIKKQNIGLAIRNIDISDNGENIIVSGGGGLVGYRVFDKYGTEKAQWTSTENPWCVSIGDYSQVAIGTGNHLFYNTEPVSNIVSKTVFRFIDISPKGNLIVAGTETGTIYFCNGLTFLKSYSVGQNISCISISEDEKIVAIVSGTSILIFDGAGNLLRKSSLDDYVESIKIYENKMFCASSDTSVYFFETDIIPNPDKPEPKSNELSSVSM